MKTMSIGLALGAALLLAGPATSQQSDVTIKVANYGVIVETGRLLGQAPDPQVQSPERSGEVWSPGRIERLCALAAAAKASPSMAD